MSNNENHNVNVYFNSACPVCQAGINAQKNKSNACQIQWNDVHQDNSLIDVLKTNLITVRKYLHVTDNNANQYIGIDAFILLWSHSPTEIWKAKTLSLPVIKQFSQATYFVFANLLYFWNVLRKNW